MKENQPTPPKESTPADTGGASTEGVSFSDMSKPPAFQFYANDFMGSTITWDAIACGMYIRLLCTQWVNGSIPDDQRRIARVAGVELVELQREWHLLEPKFPLTEDGVRKNPRLEAVRLRQSEVSLSRKKASEARWANANGYTNSDANRKQRKVKEKEKIEEVTQDMERANEKPQQTPLERFKELCGIVVQTNPERLPTGMRAAFLAYWTEPSKSGKLRWECEKFFDVGRRMDTWRRNEEKRAERFAPAAPSPTSKPWIG